MPSPTERRRNNLRAGIFVCLAIGLIVTTLVVLSGIWSKLFDDTNQYTVRYPLIAGVGNLEAGSEVRVGGVRMGSVADVRPVPPPETGGAFAAIDVEFTLDAAIALFEDAQIYVSSAILGTDSWLDIPDVGTREAGPPTGMINGSQAAGLLGTFLGAANADRTNEILENTRQFSSVLVEVKDDYGGYREKVSTILDNTEQATANFRGFSETANTTWVEKVSAIMEWTDTFRAQLDGAVADGRGLLGETRSVVDENRERIETIMTNAEAASDDVKEVTARVRAETIDRLHDLLDSGGRTLADAEATLGEMRQDYAQWSVEIGEALGNAALASQQLKLTMIEVRRSPWKVLYRPTDKELEHELLYDAARSFALATADLKAASQSVNNLLTQHGALLDQDPALAERVKRNLMDPLANYERAQKKLLDVLFETNP